MTMTMCTMGRFTGSYRSDNFNMMSVEGGGVVQVDRTPLFILRIIRDKAVDALRESLRDVEWLDEHSDVEECLAGLVEMHGRGYIHALQDSAENDLTGRTLGKLHTAQKCCQIVARREREDLAAALAGRVA